MLAAERGGVLQAELLAAGAAAEGGTAIDWSTVTVDAITCTTLAPTSAPSSKPTNAPTDNLFVLGAAGRAAEARLVSVFCAAFVAAGFWF